MSTILLLLTLQTDVAVELAKINARLAVIEAQLGIGGGGGGGVTVTMGGSTADVAWNSVGSSFALDWIGVYAVTAAHQPLGNKPWMYTSSCSTKAGASTPASGHCLLSINALAAGTYEARYFTNDSFTMIVKSAPFSIQSDTAPTGHEEHTHLFGPYGVEEICHTAPDASYRLTLQWDAPATGADGYELLVGSHAVEVGNSLWVEYVFGQSGPQCIRVRAYYEG